MLKLIQFKHNDKPTKLTDQPCLATFVRLGSSMGKFTELEVHIQYKEQYWGDFAILKAIADGYGFDKYSWTYDQTSGDLILKFEDGIHFEEFYAIVSIYRMASRDEANWLIGRTKYIKDYTSGDIPYFKAYYVSMFLGLSDAQTLIIHPYNGGHGFLYPKPGVFSYIMQWKSRLIQDTILSDLKVSMGHIKINKFFCGDDLKEITRIPEYRGILTNLESYIKNYSHYSAMTYVLKTLEKNGDQYVLK